MLSTRIETCSKSIMNDAVWRRCLGMVEWCTAELGCHDVIRQSNKLGFQGWLDWGIGDSVHWGIADRDLFRGKVNSGRCRLWYRGGEKGRERGGDLGDSGLRKTVGIETGIWLDSWDFIHNVPFFIKILILHKFKRRIRCMQDDCD